MQEAEKFPGRPNGAGPPLWLIRNDATARRLRLVEGELRTTIGFDTIISQHVDRIVLADAQRLEVLAPYSTPVPRLSLIIIGLAIGMVAGSQFHPGSAIVLALMTVTFGIVAAVVGRATSASQRIARLKMNDGTAYIVAYRVEDEDDVRRMVGEERWHDANHASPTTPMRPEEVRQAERMRYGALLMAGSTSVIAMMAAITYDSGVSDVVAIPVNILYLGTLGMVLMFSAIAWYKMTMAGRRK